MVPSVLLLSCALAQASPATGSLMLLTTVGEAPEADRRALDAALRNAVEGEPGFTLLSAAETREQLSALADMGLICMPDDATCFVKLGMAAGVDVVVVPVADGAGGTTALTLRVVDVAAAKELRQAAAELDVADQAAIARLARQGLGLEGAEKPPPSEGEGEGEGEGDKPPPPPPGGPPVGLIVTGVGGALAGLAITGAVVCDLIYADVIAVADAKARRELYQPLGAALWITSAVGLGVLGSGVVLMATSPSPE
ncbi:MAG: hypothetical protein IT383_22470 [Deltaproteobacteria bacterium]|nr:hypothetical protein [Deltaproteobacteria bacterium]